MDKHIEILAIPELDEITIKEARRIFFAYREKEIINQSRFDDDIWDLNNETSGYHFNFEIDSNKFKKFGKELHLTEDEFKEYLKTYIICRMGDLELGSLRRLIHDIKKVVQSDVSDTDSLLEVCTPETVGRVSEFFAMLPEECREEELSNLLVMFDEVEERSQVENAGKQRSLATFESYFRFDEIIKRFWNESNDEDEKLFFFPVWMWWNISGVLPLRPCEFVVTPRNCLNEIDGKYTLTVRRNRKKGTGKSKSYKISSDYELNRYSIPERLAKEIQWYLETTKDYPEEDTHTLFVTGTHYAMWERQAPYTSRLFSYMNLRTCLRYFFKMIVEDRYGYRVLYNNDGQALPNDNCIEYLHLGDTRHIALINLIAEGATPMVAMMLAGHGNPEMSSHYYSNITQLIECRTYRQYKKQIKGQQNYVLSKKKNTLPAKKSIPLGCGGRCYSEKVTNGDFCDCYKVVGPAGEVGFCKNCEFYRDDSKSFSDMKDIYKNKIENECHVLEEVVKKVRSGKGEPEEIISVILRLRDSDYSYRQYLLEKMEEEGNEQNKNI